MVMVFHTEYILKAALATSYGLLIRQYKQCRSSLLGTNRQVFIRITYTDKYAVCNYMGIQQTHVLINFATFLGICH